MNDIFIEQLVKREPNNVTKAKKAGIIIGALFIVVLCFFVPALFPFILPIAAGIIYIAYILIKRTNLEYEYSVTNDELDIDKIMNKARRKHSFNLKIKRIEIMVPVKNNSYQQEISNYSKLLDFSSGQLKDNTYAIMYNEDGKRYKIILEPNEKVLKSMKRYIPSKIKSL